jgi:hypothetical protein
LALLVIVLGLLLMGGGGFFVFLGFDIVMTERGAAMTMAGATALAGGAVTLGVGFALLRLTQILRALEARPVAAADTEPAADGRRTTGLAAAGLATAGLATAGMAAGLAVAGASPTEADGDQAAALTPASEPEIDAILMPGSPAVAAAPQDAAAALPDSRKQHPIAAADAAPADDAPSDPPEPRVAEAPVSVSDALHDPDDQPDAYPVQDGVDGEEPPKDAVVGVSTAVSATVLGSYRAGGRTYTMFSDGAVEAMTDSGVERFESMEALRSSLGRN